MITGFVFNHFGKNDMKRKMNPKSLENLKPIKKGEVRNPNGRGGARNKFAEAFIQDFYKAWQEGGAEALATVRAEDPSTFIRVASTLMPKQFEVNNTDANFDKFMENLDDKELDQLIAGLCALGAGAEVGKGAGEKDATARPDKLH